MTQETKTMQDRMEQSVLYCSNQNMIGVCKNINTRFLSCNYEEKRLSLGFEAQEWMMNPRSLMHGGILGLLFDQSMGFLTGYYANGGYVVTLDMAVHFIKAIPMGEPLRIDQQLLFRGRNTMVVRAEAYLENGNVLCGTSEGTYMIVPGKKDKKPEGLSEEEWKKIQLN